MEPLVVREFAPDMNRQLEALTKLLSGASGPRADGIPAHVEGNDEATSFPRSRPVATSTGENHDDNSQHSR